MRQWIGSALDQVMACRLFGAKTLPEPVLAYCQLDPWEFVWNSNGNSTIFFFQENAFEVVFCQNGGHFAEGEISYIWSDGALLWHEQDIPAIERVWLMIPNIVATKLIHRPWIDAIFFGNSPLGYVVICEFFKPGHRNLCVQEIVMAYKVNLLH